MMSYSILVVLGKRKGDRDDAVYENIDNHRADMEFCGVFNDGN